MEAVIFFGVILYLVFVIWAAVCFGKVAEVKGWGDMKGTVIALSILFTPAGWLLACAMPVLSRQQSIEKELKEYKRFLDNGVIEQFQAKKEELLKQL